MTMTDSTTNITLVSDKSVSFKTMFQMEAKYIPQAMGMARVFQGAIDGNTLKFDFDKALKLANDTPDMAVIGTVNQSIVKQNNQVTAMVDDVIKLLSDVVGVALDQGTATYDKFKNAITDGFTNLKSEEKGAWIFWSKGTGNKTTYTYNILFAIANEKTGSVMAAAPIGLTITVDVDKETVLGITVADKHNYEVNVQSITVVEALKN